MDAITNRILLTFKLYGKVCESCSGAMSLSLLQALAMLGCLEKRSALDSTEYWLLTSIAIISTAGFFGSLISIGHAIHACTEGHKIERFLIYCFFYPVIIGVLLTAVATFKSL